MESPEAYEARIAAKKEARAAKKAAKKAERRGDS
jgi:hypothetical protein